MSTLLVTHKKLNSSMSMRRKVEYVRRNAFQRKTILSNSSQMITCHSKGRDESSMVLSHGRSFHFLSKDLCERSAKREHIPQYLIAANMMKYFMSVSYNITRRKNVANIWITSEQSIYHTKPLQNNWNDTLHCIIFGIIHNKWRKIL